VGTLSQNLQDGAVKYSCSESPRALSTYYQQTTWCYAREALLCYAREAHERYARLLQELGTNKSAQASTQQNLQASQIDTNHLLQPRCRTSERVPREIPNCPEARVPASRGRQSGL